MKTLMLWSGLLLAAAGNGFAGDIFLLDDFSSAGGVSRLGTRWEGFTDRVMGGVSDIQVDLMPGETGRVLKMRGNVSLENNGGFIQVRLLFREGKKSYDAGDYRGIVIRARSMDDGNMDAGNMDDEGSRDKDGGKGYYIFLRTTRTVFPWAYYGQTIPVTGEWQDHFLPFSDFASANMARSSLNPEKLVSVGIVAAYREFFADLEVDYIGLYR